jgi:isopenicillin N synthase-like dioxygenase
VDNAPEARVFRPTVIDVSNVLARQPPSPAQVAQVQHECEQTGFLAVAGHALAPAQLHQLFTAAAPLFDQPLQHKQQSVVNNMQSGRGYEISPEHQAYLATWQQQQQELRAPSPAVEPSAAEGVLSERFMCKPPLSPQQLQHPHYSSDLGQVFFAPDAWLTAAVPQLQPAMQQCYQQMSAVADTLLRLFAAALDLPLDHFEALTDRHTSNMQVGGAHCKGRARSRWHCTMSGA